MHLGVEVITPRLKSFVRLVPCAVRHLVAGSAAPALAGISRQSEKPARMAKARPSEPPCLPLDQRGSFTTERSPLQPRQTVIKAGMRYSRTCQQ